MPAAQWIRSVDGGSALNLDHVVSLAVERETNGGTRTYRVVAITVLGTAVPVAKELATARQARGWIDDYLTALAMTSSGGWVGDSQE